MDLARAHGLSAQAVRNYERAGVIPSAARTASGYRVYTDRHVAALAAYVALLSGYGYATAAVIMRSVVAGAPEPALAAIDAAHVRLQRDRETVESVAAATAILASQAAPDPVPGGPVSVGVLAHRLDVAPATLRKWERAGILDPARVRNARVYSAEDVRDAELAHLLRRGGYRLDHIAVVVHQVRAAGGPGPLAASIDQWRARITARGRAMLTGAARLADYLEKHEPEKYEQAYAAPPAGVTGGAAVLDDQRGKSR